MKTRIALIIMLALGLAAAAGAADKKAAKKAGAAGSKLSAEGRSSGLLDEEKARLEAIQAALDEAARKLESKGYGKRLQLRDELRQVIIEKKVLSRDDIGELSIDSICQERLPTDRDGQNPRWSVQVTVSLRLKKTPSK